MKFLSSTGKCCWNRDALPLQSRVGAILLLVGSIFVMPLLVNFFLRDRLDIPDVLLFSSLPGIIAYRFIPAKDIPLGGFDWKFVGRVLLLFLPLMFAVGFATFLWQKLLVFFGIPFEEKQQLLTMIKDYHGGKLFQLYFGVCVIPPLTEELLFRRLIYGELLRFGFMPAFIVTALMFSLCHFFISGMPGLFILGLAFQYVYLKEKNISAAMLLHWLVNTFAFVFSM